MAVFSQHVFTEHPGHPGLLHCCGRRSKVKTGKATWLELIQGDSWGRKVVGLRRGEEGGGFLLKENHHVQLAKWSFTACVNCCVETGRGPWAGGGRVEPAAETFRLQGPMTGKWQALEH